MKKYIKLIKKSILEQIDDNRSIKTLDIIFSIDGADNPIVKVKLETCKKVQKDLDDDDYDDGGCQ